MTTVTYQDGCDGNNTSCRYAFVKSDLNSGDGALRNQTGTWSQSYGYDAYGNRWVSANSGFALSASTPTASTNFPAGTNQLNVDGSSFDAAGNMKQIGGWAFQYDGENHLRSAAINSTTSTYAYDGEGRRVQKVSGGVTTSYVYDAQGELMAEYASPGPSLSPLCYSCYLTVDHLGSTRQQTDAVSGQVVAVHDYLPFGEEAPGGTVSDPTTQRFTGKERDAETGLDWFETRYLSSAQGRFTSPDQPFAGQHIEDPQRWNMYAYVRNNPLRYTDPDGRDCFQGFGSCVDYLIGGAKAVANLVPATATLVNRVLTGGLVGDAPMFQPANEDQRQGIKAANVMMIASPVAEAGAAAAVEAIGTGVRVETSAVAAETTTGTTTLQPGP